MLTGNDQLLISGDILLRLVQDQQAEQEHWNRNQRPHKKAETTFVVTPEVHYNQGYTKDSDNQPRAEENHERNIQTNYQAVFAPISLSGHGAVGGQPETPFRYNLSTPSTPQPQRNPLTINTVSESTSEYPDPSQRNPSNMYSSQVLNPYISYGSLSVAGTEI